MITGGWVPGSLSDGWWLQAALSRGGEVVVAHDILIHDLTLAVGKAGVGALQPGVIPNILLI